MVHLPRGAASPQVDRLWLSSVPGESISPSFFELHIGLSLSQLLPLQHLFCDARALEMHLVSLDPHLEHGHFVGIFSHQNYF